MITLNFLDYLTIVPLLVIAAATSGLLILGFVNRAERRAEAASLETAAIEAVRDAEAAMSKGLEVQEEDGEVVRNTKQAAARHIERAHRIDKFRADLASVKLTSAEWETFFALGSEEQMVEAARLAEEQAS
ncbi:hypothetical protein GCM10027515_26700 [Schumannella luteola]|uniref:Uncharacterized protein n=1 Tax=Schumannella luteola TaxID=472059 RepID=A0A852YAK5_9MICO|nr:hypothetical protein [Schumannella luteola]NYG99533.1 hypothetical protein [Schumannella luteola]TPX03852.1 hypothetical protein FJ656_15080 [Schumannella luteola]